MKKIINGKTYNTETAKELGYRQFGNYGDFDMIAETLYQKKGGEFFLYAEGGANTKYAIHSGPNSWGGGEHIIPLIESEAMKWAEENLDGDEYEEIFGEVEEEPSRADWARRIRERSGLSRRAFGEKYGINPKTIEAWEYGYGNPQEYVLELLEKAEALEQVQCYAYFFREYRADWSNGSGKTFRDEDKARAYCWKTWEAMNDGDRETYIEDPAGEFRVFAAFCEWDSELGEWVPDAGGTETEILNMLD